MSDDDMTEMIETLLRQQSAVITTAKARGAREMQGVHHLDRRGMRTPPEHIRNVQFNVKVSQRWKSRVERYAAAKGMSSTEVIVRAFDAYAAANKE
jgi:hypothetical protein